MGAPLTLAPKSIDISTTLYRLHPRPLSLYTPETKLSGKIVQFIVPPIPTAQEEKHF